jgi:DNA repair protein RecN (Recombination protein N)
LFALRARGRRHGVEPQALAEFQTDLRNRLALIETGSDMLSGLARAAAEAEAHYKEVAAMLSAKRTEAAKKFDKAIAAELPALKLDRARVQTEIAPLTESGAEGRDRVTFLIATNPGAAPGPLAKIASGGELARFMLALKVVLAGKSEVPVMVFDEVDSGIGGATADAVGERLRKLGESVQVLVVTHSPQVAARAAQHWRVEKNAKKNTTATIVVPLDVPARREEIARMLSGASITDEARAAAAKLLDVA